MAVQPASSDICSPLSKFTDIPIVSFAAWREGGAESRRAFAERLRQICHEIGFFYLIDHGIDASFVSRLLAAQKQFLTLPEETKSLVDKSKSRHFRGWERVGAELTDNRVDWREQLDLSSDNPPFPDDALPHYLRLDGPNQWLPDELCPGFKGIVEEYFSRMKSLADELMAALGVALGLPEDTFSRLFGERPLALAKLARYPTTPAGGAGVNAHKDAGFLTLLMQHGVRGLQALSPDGAWVDVEPVPDTLVVNLGEMLQSLTGNYFVATTHRVVAGQERFATAYFHGPDLRTPLSPLSLDPSFAAAVAASERHRSSGFMRTRDELLEGASGTGGRPVSTYGIMLWNYYCRAYPDNVKTHYPDAML